MALLASNFRLLRQWPPSPGQLISLPCKHAVSRRFVPLPGHCFHAATQEVCISLLSLPQASPMAFLASSRCKLIRPTSLRYGRPRFQGRRSTVSRRSSFREKTSTPTHSQSIPFTPPGPKLTQLASHPHFSITPGLQLPIHPTNFSDPQPATIHPPAGTIINFPSEVISQPWNHPRQPDSSNMSSSLLISIV